MCKRKILFRIFFLSSMFFCSIKTECAFGQDETFTQFWNEYALTHTFNNKWAIQLDLGLSTTSIRNHTSIFGSILQVDARAWVHYSPADRWKLSFFYAYFYNHDVPEISQRRSPEWRSAMQAIYRINNASRLSLSTRLRIEDRHIFNTDSVYEAVNRFRAQVKMVYPINGKTIDKGVLYSFASNELFFKTKSKISGPDFFDRNRFSIGLGYAVTNDLQVEIGYANEILPRAGKTEVYNAFQLNVGFNNLFTNLQKRLFGPKQPMHAIDSSN